MSGPEIVLYAFLGCMIAFSSPVWMPLLFALACIIVVFVCAPFIFIADGIQTWLSKK